MEEPKESHPAIAIYSKMAVVGFSIFVNPIFGGFMLRQNLIEIGERKAGIQALLTTVSLFLFSVIVSIPFGKAFSAIAFAIYLIGSAIIVEYFYRKYFPDESQFEKKSIIKPLRIALLLAFIISMMLVIFEIPLPA